MKQGAMCREYRAAVVFYGGVSLAAYENGVARAFYDATQRAGVFRPLMALLSGEFVVDVISGTSAGGINGLMLATALENGTDFKQTADLWRESGGIDALLRDPDDDATPPSLLKGETYYIGELRRAFRALTAEKPAADAPKEIDLFVTATDLTGQKAGLVDAAGSAIDTMNHRLVFHLKHRKDRARLGITALDIASLDASDAETHSLQADIIAGVARTTSSVPGAFPPFTPAELANEQMADTLDDTPARVREALERMSHSQLQMPNADHGDHPLVDGGVLDNAPFKPVLDAIFHRMPSESMLWTDRKLFYVEPNPASFCLDTQFTPLEVVFNAATTLPMYDSIAADLKRLERHNHRVRRFRRLRLNARKTSCNAPPDNYPYVSALQHAIGCMLVGANPAEVDGATALQGILPALEACFPQADAVDTARALDISFHLRRAYDLLYDEIAFSHAERYAVGRVIKVLKLLRDVWLSRVSAKERKSPTLTRPSEAIDQNLVARRLQLLARYLDAEWLKDARFPADIADLSSKELTALKEKAAQWLTNTLDTEPPSKGKGAETPPTPTPKPSSRVMEGLETALRSALVDGAHADRIDRFAAVDASLYPAELAAGLYELDEIELIRIAPRDAALPRGISGPDKVTGDRLANFSAFLRRDWRTNDIAWGHSDGLCQIIRGLLTEKTWADISQRLSDEASRAAILKHFETDALVKALCGGGSVKAELETACEKVTQAFDAYLASPSEETQDAFRDALTTAAQIAAMGEYVDKIAADTERQNQAWHWKVGGKRFLEPGKNALDQVKALRLGAKSIKDELPSSLIVEYLATAALLIFGMVGRSLDRAGAGFTLFKTVSKVVSPVLGFVRFVSRQLRSDSPVGAAVLLALFVGGVSFGVAGAVASSGLTAIIGFGAAFVVAVIVAAVHRPQPLKWVLFLVMLVGLASLGWSELGRRILTDVGHFLVNAGNWLMGR